ncbi:MAG: site-specific DNA-methyltransferase [Elusimicrobia bacterium]|nr:site-specific DNA-methyltransferase [Elusimicrobiota bacterium]
MKMMYPRLYLARNLMAQNGIIFINIDDTEIDNLKKLCNEVFGENEFIGCLPWKGRGGRQDSKYVAQIHEYVLAYGKSLEEFVVGGEARTMEGFVKWDDTKKLHYKTSSQGNGGKIAAKKIVRIYIYSVVAPDGKEVFPMLPNGKPGCWRWSKKRMQQEFEHGNVEFVASGDQWILYEKLFQPKSDDKVFAKCVSWLDDVGTTANGTKELKELFSNLDKPPFDFPKPKN